MTTTTTERRQVPRKRLERLAYIDIGPNNGGIVLNASDQGLCFHSIAPVEKNGPVRFSLLDHNRRIEASAELMWTDEMQKVGGLRFTTVTAEARDRINGWIAQLETLPEENKNFKFAMVTAFRALGVPRFDKPRARNLSSALAASRSLQLRVKLKGFSGGLITGFMVSACLAVLFMSSYAHRRELGRSLIRWGERLAATSEGQTQHSVGHVVASSLLGRNDAIASPATDLSIHAPDRVLRPEKADPKLVPTTTASDPEPSPAVIDMIHRKPSPVRKLKNGSREPVAPSPASVLASSMPLPAATNLLKPAAPTPQLELANVVPLRGFSADPSLALTMYFDVGRFKDELAAHNLSVRVADLGLPTTVAKRGHLWANSYQVLVGPYRDQQEERRLENNLVSHGFKPRPFERGSRDFVFASPLVLHASNLPVGDLTIRWESFVSDAKVKFLRGGNVVVTADGRWMPGAVKYWRDEYVYQKNGDGSRTLLEIHFAGLNRALVFRD